MSLSVKRTNTSFLPDFKKVIARFFALDTMRTTELVMRIYHMTDEEAESTLNQILREFSKRHRNMTRIFRKHFSKVKFVFADLDINVEDLSERKQLLIGSYFTMEYSIESAAFFNPSIVEDPDQTGLEKGEKRIIMSFRATGEGHISSLVFRRGVLDKDNKLMVHEPGQLIDGAERVKKYQYEKKSFSKKLEEMDIPKSLYGLVLDKLPPQFIYKQIKEAVQQIIDENDMNVEKQKVLQEIIWLADSHYEINFSMDTDLSERVIFPIGEREKNGIEDARFVKFINEDGSYDYYATYTAYDGYTIIPKLIQTKDFYHFKVIPIQGKNAQDKNLALFPRKINGKYAMLSRIDGKNNYIMFSDKINIWENARMLCEPQLPWEYIQIGNGGSPLETKEGWLMITHGVGPMRKYSLGACLLDLEDPSKVIGCLKEPLLTPNEDERDGYVPNVVYTCGTLIHNDHLIIPYAMADYATGLATIELDEILKALKNSNS